MNGRNNRLQKRSTEELKERLIRGDVDALDVIYRRYYRRLLHYGIQLAGIGRSDHIEDIVQDLFIWLARNYDKLHKVKDLEAYLFQSLRRNTFSKLKLDQESEAKHQRFIRLSSTIGEDVYRSSEEEFIKEESEANISRALTQELDKLPTHQKEVLYLRFYQERSYKQISEILSISNQVARNFASRGLKKLREQLKNASRLLLLFTLPQNFF